MHKDTLIAWLCTTLSSVMVAVATDDIIKYIELAITIIGGIITIALDIYIWYKKASADGKITTDEVDSLKDTINKDTNSIKGDKK